MPVNLNADLSSLPGWLLAGLLVVGVALEVLDVLDDDQPAPGLEVEECYALCGGQVGSRAPEVVGVSATETSNRRPENRHERHERDRLDEFHRRNPHLHLSTVRGVDDVQHPDDDQYSHDDSDGREGDDHSAAVSPVLLDRVHDA